MSYGKYSLFYQQQGDTVWNAIVLDSAVEIRNSTFGLWNTNGLAPNSYLLELVVYNSVGDSVTAIKSVALMPSILGVKETGQTNLSLNVFPNPVNNKTVFTLNLEKATATRLAIYDICGKEESIIVDSKLESGIHSYAFDAANYSSGVYLYTLVSDEEVLTGKFVIQH